MRLQQDGTDLENKPDVLPVRRPISERRLQANRANAQRSTGPRTEAGKAVSSKNALRHGILSSSLDLRPANPTPTLDSSMMNRSLASSIPAADSALREIHRIWGKLERVVIFEKDCAQRANGLERNARLIHRYERMLTRQLHARIRECAGLEDDGSNEFGGNV